MKLFKFICGSDEKIGAFKDEQAAYDGRTEIDPTFYFLPVVIEEVTLPGYVISITPIAFAPPAATPPVPVKTEEQQPFFQDPEKMSLLELRAWLNSKDIKYHPQTGEKKIREMVILKMGVLREDGEQ